MPLFVCETPRCEAVENSANVVLYHTRAAHRVLRGRPLAGLELLCERCERGFAPLPDRRRYDAALDGPIDPTTRIVRGRAAPAGI